MSTEGPFGVGGEGTPPRTTARKARRRRRALALSAVTLFGSVTAAATALVLADALHERELAAPATTTSPPTTATTTPATARCRSPLTVDDPLRLWIGGDSLAGSLGPSLGKDSSETGIVITTFDSRVSSGLASPEFFDWPKQATSELAQVDPEVVVFIIGANDYNITPSQPVDASGTPFWKAKYKLQIEQMLDILDGDGTRPVYWVGSPTIQDKRKDAGASQVNEVARSVIGEHDDVTYVDAYKLFSGPDGKYAPNLPGVNGKTVRVRAGDGLHLTPAGGDLLARPIFDLINARCNLEDQAVPGHTQPVIQAKGSGQVPGTHRETPAGATTASTTPATTATTQPVTTAPTSPAPTLPI